MSEATGPETSDEAPRVSFELTEEDGAALADARLMHDPMGRLLRGVLTAAVSVLPAMIGAAVNVRVGASLGPVALFVLPGLAVWFGLPLIARRSGRATVRALNPGQRTLTFVAETDGLVVADAHGQQRLAWRLVADVDEVPAGLVITTRHPLHHLVPSRALTPAFTEALQRYGTRSRGTTT